MWDMSLYLIALDQSESIIHASWRINIFAAFTQTICATVKWLQKFFVPG